MHLDFPLTKYFFFLVQLLMFQLFCADQYNRIYSPVSFAKKFDPNGNYVRHFLPVLKGMFKSPLSCTLSRSLLLLIYI